jgi:hypothetical protein
MLFSSDAHLVSSIRFELHGSQIRTHRGFHVSRRGQLR